MLFTALQGLLQWFPFLASDSLFDLRQDVEKQFEMLILEMFIRV